MAHLDTAELTAAPAKPKGVHGGYVPAGAKVEDTFVFPASREQTRYWMLAQLDPSSTASNMAISFDIEGLIDDTLAESAIAALTMRHEALRTIFRLEAGVLSQVILNRPLYCFEVEDLSQALSSNPGAAEEAVNRHGHTAIDLHSGPVLHARLIHLGEQRHILALTMNHIVCDGWSNGILIRDFTLLYEALVDGCEAKLPLLPFQFADFSVWQNEYLESPAAREASAFWKEHLTPGMLALDLPTDHPRVAGRSFPGYIESALLPKHVDDRLKEYCRTSGSTKHIVLLAAFQALCARYTGQTEFLLGSTIANRTQPGMDDVVGRFANPQIIVARVDGDPSFAELEQRVRDWEMAAYTHQDLPFSRIIEDFQIDQAGATSQFLQVWFLYQKAFMQPQAGRTIRLTPRRSLSGGVDFDVLVSIVERAEGPRIQMEYNTQLFQPERIRALIAAFSHLLGEALADPGLPLSRLSSTALSGVLPGVKSAAGAVNTAMPSVPVPVALSIFERLSAHARSAPDDIAVVDQHRVLSWQQLEESSFMVASTLLRAGVTEESTVAVLLTPAVESVIALLAALRTGALVLPLPGHGKPTQIADLLKQTPGCVLLAPRGFQAAIEYQDFTLPAQVEKNQLPLVPASTNDASLLILNHAEAHSVEAVALSTVMASIDAACKAASIHHGESLLAFPAAGPLAACLDLLLAVATGSQLTFVRDLSTASIEEQLERNQVTRLLLSTGDLKALAVAGWQGDRRVSVMIRDGRLPAALLHLSDGQQSNAQRPDGQRPEALLPRRLQAACYFLLAPGFSGYAAYQELSRRASHAGLLPLGTGELVVRDLQGRVLPDGAFGALQSGDGRSTGFMAHTSAGGAIELADASHRFFQLRGHRVCLGEIDDALLSASLLRDGACAVIEAGGKTHLVACLVARSAAVAGPTAAQDTAAIRRLLSETLPSHLVPAEYVWLDRLPLTLDGHLDQTALLSFDHAPLAVKDGKLTAVEEKLSAIWREVLGLREVDLHTSFFDLGGSSLLLVRLFARINKAFDASLPITAIFDAKTIAELALALGGQTSISPLVRVQTGGDKTPLFMIHSYLLYKGLSTSLGPDQPFYGLREVDSDEQLTIEERVSGYVKEIRRVQRHGPYHLAGWCAAGPLTVEVARLLIDAGQEVNYVALFDSWLPGYLESVEASSTGPRSLFHHEIARKVAFHRNKLRGLTTSKQLLYLRLAAAHAAKEVRYRIYLKNWERLRRLSETYHFALPQFMHNTSLNTFSALKEYRERLLAVRLTLIRATDAREIPGAAVSCGWERVAEHGVDVQWAPGDHESMFIGRNLEATASLLKQGLEAADRAANKGIKASHAAASQTRETMLNVDCHSL